ncbi:MAG: hypothetical protein M3024_11665 [Candidatus Dormibacteraeota bacterium]|nr:hypothetical protein [Candidatus Dormibacteraeota bacterium]
MVVGTIHAGLNLGVGSDFHGPGQYSWQPNSPGGAHGAVSTGPANGLPARYLMVGGTVSFDGGGAAGSVNADFALQSDATKNVHLAGNWSCLA